MKGGPVGQADGGLLRDGLGLGVWGLDSRCGVSGDRA